MLDNTAEAIKRGLLRLSSCSYRYWQGSSSYLALELVFSPCYESYQKILIAVSERSGVSFCTITNSTSRDKPIYLLSEGHPFFDLLRWIRITVQKRRIEGVLFATGKPDYFYIEHIELSLIKEELARIVDMAEVASPPES